MESKLEKILFLVTPGRRHLRIETDQNYTHRELAVLLTAFRKSLVSADPRTIRKTQKPVQTHPPNRIVGPGYVIELLGQ